jgi:CubicO group peptidase (beta-lactamase class C family)
MTDFQEVFIALESFVEERMRVDNAPGLALAVTDREKLLHVSLHGFADLGAQIPVTPNTLFEIGSVSKSFTAFALMQLVEDGKLDLHAPVTHYLPWFQVPSEHKPITLHHLLSHTAGLINGMDFSAEAKYEVYALRETEATAAPGTFFHYSNVGYKTLGLVLEELLGRSYAEIIQERILDPLEMRATRAAITHETRKQMAVGYESLYDDRPGHPSYPRVPATWLEYEGGDGSIAATAADMAAYVRMLMNRGQGQGTRLVSEGSFALMTQRVIETQEEGSSYGYGLVISESDGRTCLGHDGGMVGYYSAILADMDDGLGIVVLTNGPGEPGGIARSALRLLGAALHNQEPPALIPVPDRTQVENGIDYGGTYEAGPRAFSLAAAGGRLIMRYGDETIALERRGRDCFYVPHVDFALFLLRFGREGDQIVEAFHGPDWYTRDCYPGPTNFDYPGEWERYAGHYRSHNPWYPNFRVVLRKGALVLISLNGDEAPMGPLNNSVFRVGKDEQSPERIRFDTVLNGRALHARFSCCDFYRTCTP